MPNMKITKRTVDAVSSESREILYWDPDLRGFGLKVTPAGSKTYVLQYRMGGRGSPSKRYTIGRHGSPWSPATAREEAIQLLTLVRQGTDPRGERRAKQIEASELGFELQAERFIDRYLRAHWTKTWKEGARLLRVNAIPTFRDRPISQISKADVSDLLVSLSDRPALRRQVFAVLRKFFAWAVKQEGLINTSPLDGMVAPKPPRQRDRVLTIQELRAAWITAGQMNYPFGPLFQLLIATLRRETNVAALSLNEIDFEQARWILPARKSKIGEEHIQPLNESAISVLNELPFSSGYCFTTTGKTPVSGFSKAKKRWDRMMLEFLRCERGSNCNDTDDEVLPPWRLHDIRRTGATFMQQMGVPIEVTEEILEHKSGTRGGVAGVYNKYRYLPEKAAALSNWGQILSELSVENSATVSRTAYLETIQELK